MSTEEPKPEEAPTEVEGNQPQDEPSPEQTKATEAKPPEPTPPPKVEEPPKTPSKDITFGYIPEGNMAHFTTKDGDSIDYMQVAALTIEHGGRIFTYRRNRID